MTPPDPGAVLVLCDLSPASANAAWRAALVARDLGAPLRLLHAHRAPARRAQAEAELRQLAGEIRPRMGVAAAVQVVAGDGWREAVFAARDAQLLVVGVRRGNALGEFFLGTPAERLVRLCGVPVLAVKRPAKAAYRRVLVPVELGAHAAPAIAAAACLSRDPRMEVLHALQVRSELGLRVPDAPEAVLRRLRQRSAYRARVALEDLIAQAGAEAHGALAAVTFGHPATAVLAREQAMRADLVVIGRRARGLLADFFQGGVTQCVLAGSRADVLVLPRVAAAAWLQLPAREARATAG